MSRSRECIYGSGGWQLGEVGIMGKPGPGRASAPPTARKSASAARCQRQDWQGVPGRCRTPRGSRQCAERERRGAEEGGEETGRGAAGFVSVGRRVYRVHGAGARARSGGAACVCGHGHGARTRLLYVTGRVRVGGHGVRVRGCVGVGRRGGCSPGGLGWEQIGV